MNGQSNNGYGFLGDGASGRAGDPDPVDPAFCDHLGRFNDGVCLQCNTRLFDLDKESLELNEQRTAKAAGHPEACGYTLRATVQERFEHFRTRQPDCGGFAPLPPDYQDELVEKADALPHDQAVEFADKAIELLMENA